MFLLASPRLHFPCDEKCEYMYNECNLVEVAGTTTIKHTFLPTSIRFVTRCLTCRRGLRYRPRDMFQKYSVSFSVEIIFAMKVQDMFNESLHVSVDLITDTN